MLLSKSEALRASRELYEQLKCESCKKLPKEPYITGVCDHLLCRNCIVRSNKCPICKLYYTDRDLLMMSSIQDMIQSIGDIISIIEDGNEYKTNENEDKCEVIEREVKKSRIEIKETETNIKFIRIEDPPPKKGKCIESEKDKTEYIIINEDSNDDSYQSMLQNNVSNSILTKPERPKLLGLEHRHDLIILENDVAEIKDHKNNEVLEIIDEDEMNIDGAGDTEPIEEDKPPVKEISKVNEHDTEPIEEKVANVKKSSNVAEEDALNLFMSFYGEDKNNNKNDSNDVIEVMEENDKNITHINNNISPDETYISIEPVVTEKYVENNDLIDEEHFASNSNLQDITTCMDNKLNENERMNNFNKSESKRNDLNENQDMNGSLLTVKVNESLTITNEANESVVHEKLEARKSKRQNKTVIFKPIANKKAALKEEPKEVEEHLDVSKVEDENSFLKPRGRGRGKKVKTEKVVADVVLSQTQGDGTKKRLKKNEKGETQLHLAAMEGNYEACKTLLAQNMDPNVTDYAGWTALHEACGSGYIDIVRLLVENNANINVKGFKDSTPLHEALLNSHVDCAKYILERGADVSIRNSHGFLAKDFLKNCKNSNSLVKLFERMELNVTQTQKQEPIEMPSSTATSKIRGKRAPKAKTVTIYSTGMSEDEKIKLIEISKKMNFKFVREMTSHVTHVVFKDTQNNNTCQRTINYMKAVLMGSWIVSVKWIEDSLNAGHLLEENAYEAKGSHKIPNSNASLRGRMNASYENPNLFDDFFFFFYGDFKVFDKNDLIQLVKLGGATVIRREPKLERLDELMTKIPFHADKNTNLKCTHFIIYDVNKPKEIIRTTYLNTVNVNWLFDCIDEFTVRVDENSK